MREIAILGSTGSIGTQALAVIAKNPGTFRITALAAGGANPTLLARQAWENQVPFVAVADEAAVAPVKAALAELARQAPRNVPPIEVPTRIEVCGGAVALEEAARSCPAGTVLNGITGGVGLAPTLAALDSGATLALANKESLVVGGVLVKAAMRRPGQIVPVDSEHSAIAQALLSGRHEKGLTSPVLTGKTEVAKIILTASGGPFRGRTRAELGEVTATQALDHPTWAMGPVVTVNSSTLMNKGLELIEAQLLFDVAPSDIIPVVHPQSVIHSLVQWRDGSTIAQASPPDMGLPIALGLTWPERLAEVAAPCQWETPTSWDFEPVDHETFPALRLAQAAVAQSPTHPAVLNAANEVCVAAFLAGQLSYLGIVDTVQQVVAEYQSAGEPDLAAVMAAQDFGSRRAQELVANQ